MAEKGYLHKFEREVRRHILSQMSAEAFFDLYPSMKDAMWANAHMYAETMPDDPGKAALAWYEECIKPRFEPGYNELEVEDDKLGTRIRIWEGDGFRVEVWDTHQDKEPNHWQLAYRFYDCGKLIFEGTDFGCPKHQAVDSDWAVTELLCWMSLRPGDTDSEYFDRYTEAQMEWCRADRCEWLSCYANDLRDMLDAFDDEEESWQCEESQGPDHSVITCKECYDNFLEGVASAQ